MVLRVGGQHSVVILLKTADSVFQALLARDSPAAHKSLGVPFIRAEPLTVVKRSVEERRLDFRIIRHSGDFPRLASVADETLGEKHHRSHMFKSKLGGCESRIEAVSR